MKHTAQWSNSVWSGNSMHEVDENVFGWRRSQVKSISYPHPERTIRRGPGPHIACDECSLPMHLLLAHRLIEEQNVKKQKRKSADDRVRRWSLPNFPRDREEGPQTHRVGRGISNQADTAKIGGCVLIKSHRAYPGLARADPLRRVLEERAQDPAVGVRELGRAAACVGFTRTRVCGAGPVFDDAALTTRDGPVVLLNRTFLVHHGEGKRCRALSSAGLAVIWRMTAAAWAWSPDAVDPAPLMGARVTRNRAGRWCWLSHRIGQGCPSRVWPSAGLPLPLAAKGAGWICGRPPVRARMHSAVRLRGRFRVSGARLSGDRPLQPGGSRDFSRARVA